jgi:hypothetical protein
VPESEHSGDVSMGTACLTVVLNKEEQEIVWVYVPQDGYPASFGRILADLLSGITIVDGLPAQQTDPNIMSVIDELPTIANGLECLAAEIVKYLKEEPGYVYLYPPGTKGLYVAYTYVVTGQFGEGPCVRVYDDYYKSEEAELLFDGPASDLHEWIDSRDDEITA